MLKEEKFIPTFNSFGWTKDEEKNAKVKQILSNVRTKRSKGLVPIFSIIDSDDDLEDIISNSKFFTNSNKKIEEFVLIGTGGSSLGAEALIDSITIEKKINFHILDNLDSFKLKKLFKKIESKNIKVLAISKSGNTTETISLLLIMCQWLESRGINIQNNVMVMTENRQKGKNNFILDIAESKNLAIVQHARNISGRFSSLSSTGLLPAVVMGADPYAIRSSSRKTLDFILEDKNFLEFGSSIFCGNSFTDRKLNCFITYADFLDPMARWYRQLWSESLGKNGKGSFFITAKGPIDQHSQLQMWLDGPNIGVYTFLLCDHDESGTMIPEFETLSWLSNSSLESLSNIMSCATCEALKNKGRPVRIIKIPYSSSQSIASLMSICLVEVMVLAELLNVDPYNQPAVEAIKINTLKRLKM